MVLAFEIYVFFYAREQHKLLDRYRLRLTLFDVGIFDVSGVKCEEGEEL